MARSVTLILVSILSVHVLTAHSALPNEAFIVSLKTDNSITDNDAMQNDEPATGRIEYIAAEIYSLKIHSDIRYRYCRTQVISRVANRHANNSNEVVFQMVLPETAFISKFSLNRWKGIRSLYVKGKEEARQIYSDARSRGQSAGLVEFNARHANVFNVNVNVEAKSKVTFNLTYEELLIRKFNRYEHVININPEKFSRIPDFEVTVNLHESQNITLLKVPVLRNDTENAILDDEKINTDVSIVRQSGNSALVSWTPTVETRIHDQWNSPMHDVKRFVVQYDVARESDAGEILLMNGYFVHFFAPKDILPLRKHVVFVLDTSGSMTGNRIAQLKQAMKYVLDDLKPDEHFNIVKFSTYVEVWRPESHQALGKVPLSSRVTRHFWDMRIFGDSSTPDPFIWNPILATEVNLLKAHEFINSLSADGLTNIHDALGKALHIISEAKPIISAATTEPVEPMIIFMTDGEPTSGVTNKNTILEKIKSLNTESPVPIYSIGFGTGVDFPFLKSLSLQNKAFARKIYEAGDADIQMRGFYKEISSPALSNLKFQYTSDKYTVHKLSNKNFQNFQLGSEIAVAGYLRPKPKGSADMINSTESTVMNAVDVAPSILYVDVDAKGRNGSISFKQDDSSKLTENSEEYFLERLWAYITIKQLLEKESGTSGAEDYVDFEDEQDSSNGTATNHTNTLDDNFVYSVSDVSEDLATTISPRAKPAESPKERALRIALKYGLVTPITSLVVLRPNETASSVDLEPLALPIKNQFQVRLHTASKSNIPQSYNLPSTPPLRLGAGPKLDRSFILPRAEEVQLNSLSGQAARSRPMSTSSSTNTETSGHAVRNSPRRTYATNSSQSHYRKMPERQSMSETQSNSKTHSSSGLSRSKEIHPSPVLSARPIMNVEMEQFSSSNTINDELRRIQWLWESNGNMTHYISVNHTPYYIISNAQAVPHQMYLPMCVLKTSSSATQEPFGICKPLKDCVNSAFWNDRSVYLTNYFCPLRHMGMLYAGACCPSSPTLQLQLTDD